jgi:hypothetical protein
MNTEQPRPDDICAHKNCGKKYSEHWWSSNTKDYQCINKEGYVIRPYQTFKPSPKQEEPRPNWHCQSCGAENISSVSYCQVCKDDGPYEYPVITPISEEPQRNERLDVIRERTTQQTKDRVDEQFTDLQKTFAEVMDMTHTEITDLIVELRGEIDSLKGEVERLKKEERQTQIGTLTNNQSSKTLSHE